MGILDRTVLAGFFVYSLIFFCACEARGGWSRFKFYGVYNAPHSLSLRTGMEEGRSMSVVLALQNRGSFPFVSAEAMENLDPDAIEHFPSSADLDDELLSHLRLNVNRMAIRKTGVTCGVPGSGKVDPFDLGPKFFLPPETSRAARRRMSIKNKRKMNKMNKMNITMRAIEGRSMEFEDEEFMTPSREIVRTKRGANLMQGEVAKQNELCWQVKVIVDLGNGTLKVCGGIIVGSKTILTAAHCVMNENGERPFHVTAVTVQVGDESLDGGQRGCSEIFSVDLIVPHPSYDMVLQNNDIALVMLMNDVDLVKKPCACKLCIKDKEPRAGSVCLVAGYGQTRQNSESEERASLRWFKQRVFRQAFDSKCAFHIKSMENTNLDDFICAGDIDSDTSCQGDQGGPFVCFDESSDSHYAAGIISFSGGCGKHIGSQYTKVRNYLDWIEHNISWRTVALQRGWNREVAREAW